MRKSWKGGEDKDKGSKGHGAGTVDVKKRATSRGVGGKGENKEKIVKSEALKATQDKNVSTEKCHLANVRWVTSVKSLLCMNLTS